MWRRRSHPITYFHVHPREIPQSTFRKQDGANAQPARISHAPYHHVVLGLQIVVLFVLFLRDCTADDCPVALSCQPSIFQSWSFRPVLSKRAIGAFFWRVWSAREHAGKHETKMLLCSWRCYPLLVLVVVTCLSRTADASSQPILPSSASTSLAPTFSQPPETTCEPRTINYITHSLPQVCLRCSRTDAASDGPPASTTAVGGTTTLAASHDDARPSPSNPGGADTTAEVEEEEGALDDSSFLSFEEWKRQMLEKEHAVDAAPADRRHAAKEGDRRRGSDGIQDALSALQEDVVIDPNYAAYLSHGQEESAATTDARGSKDTVAGTEPRDEGPDDAPHQRTRYRSNDAGKTCKERFNFASLDAGAQVMKTNAEAKSASALLKEDRDAYMLNTCQAKNKMLIVELSESILIDTVALANFEFFSSTFRQFRLGVSDRYPVNKQDRWVDLGTYEATNSREIQAFLIEDPRIWARYLKVDFLTHYGNEFYCPISLLRVHGRTMIQDVLSMDEGMIGDDDVDSEIQATETATGSGSLDAHETEAEADKKLSQGLEQAGAAIENLVKTAKDIATLIPNQNLSLDPIREIQERLGNVSNQLMTTPWQKASLQGLFAASLHDRVCLKSQLGTPRDDATQHDTIEPMSPAKDSPPLASSTVHSDSGNVHSDSVQGIDLANPNVTKSPKVTSTTDAHGRSATVAPGASSASNDETLSTAYGGSRATSRAAPTPSSHNPHPSTQESFFKMVSKRLQLLEANSTLSLQYIEGQSRILRDAFTKVEKRHISKTTTFLATLNSTVFEELRRLNQQYDQIWQSTVIELETQRDRSQQEVAAISTRLSILADELVFQKRMSVVQSVLLLLCLGLVIFSRGSPGAYLDIPIIQNRTTRTRYLPDVPIGSPFRRPVMDGKGPSMHVGSWPASVHRRQRSDESVDESVVSQRSRSRPRSPLPPLSAYSVQEAVVQDGGGHEQMMQEAWSTASVQSTPSKVQQQPGGGTDQAEWHLIGSPNAEGIPTAAYPDFRNSALWLSGGPSGMDAGDTTPPRPIGVEGMGDDCSQLYRPRNSGVVSPTLVTFYEHTSDDTSEVSRLPSPPPEGGRLQFNIARKPLPALPRVER